MPLSNGTRLGRYEIRSKLGEGGMGEVYRARDEKLNRDVAVKVLPATLSNNGDRLRRFEQEAQATGTLNHPNILAVYDVGMHEDAPYVVSELLEGENFRELLGNGPLSMRKAIDYASQIARGLAAAHEKGIVHRDLKPDNLFLTRDERVKILDFGLAKLTQPSGEDIGQTDIATRLVHTDPGTVMGTAGYMSPEQVRAESLIDYRSDIFSFGSVLYEMLSGRRAFHGNSAIETLNAILKEEPEELTRNNPNIPPALERVVWHCLEKSPDRRFQSASDVAFTLESLSGVTSHPSQQTFFEEKPLPFGRRWSQKRLVLPAAGALLLLLAAALALTYWRPQNARNTVKLTLAPPEKTTLPANVTLSPDGLRVAFLANNADGKRLLWVRRLDSLIAQPLASTDGATSPFWSPDSRFIGYFANRKLFTIDAAGGRPQFLCDVGEHGGGAWNRDGVILFGALEGLYRVPVHGGTPVLATKVSPKEEAHRWPYFLPDSRHFLFLGDADTTEEHHIRLGSLDSTDSQILFGAISRVVFSPPGYLLYVSQGALTAVPFDPKALKVSGDPATVAEHIALVGNNHEFDFSVSDDGSLAYQSGSLYSQFTWFDRNGKKLGTVGEPTGADYIALSPDGRTLAAGLLDADGRESDVWLYDLDRPTVSRLTFDPQGDGTPLWSPDGTRIVFGSNRRGSGVVDLYEKASSGAGDDRLLLESNAGKFATSWSRDGQFILFENWAPQTKGAIWLMEVSAGNRVRPVLQTNSFNQFQGQFSPDGHFIAYTSDESGRPEVYVQRFPPSSDKWPVSSGGGFEPLWRSDGKEIFFITEEGKLMAADIRIGNGFESGIPKELFQTGFRAAFAEGYGYVVSKDGQRFLLSNPAQVENSSPLTVVLNWAAASPQR